MTLDQARRQLGEHRTAKQSAQSSERAAAAAVQQLRGELGAQHPRVLEAERVHAAAVARLDGVRRAEQATRAGLAADLAEWVKDQADEVATLSSDLPIVMFPVRLETKFSRDRRELLVRIYPDVICADAFDASLTVTERELGEGYWRTAWTSEREPEAWAALLTAMKPARAAWVVRRLTPANVAERPAGAPRFPVTETRPDTWSRAVETRLLPDRWIAVAHRDGREVKRAAGTAIREPLALTLAPDAHEDELVELSDDITVDTGFLWALDFARAEEAGMAIRVPLDADDLARGFDRLVVLGVKSSLGPEATGAELAALIDAQHYSRGVALIQQGTPTNNTSDVRAAYPPPSAPAHSFAIERGAPLVGEGTDGALLAAAIGVPPAIMAHIEGADRREQRGARAMARALWPGTLGYFVEQMLSPAMTPGLIQETRRHFEDHVRGRGPVPALRVGTTVYGVLPVTSVGRWSVAGTRGLAASMPPLLRKARGVWLRLAARGMRVGASADPEADLLAVLGMDAMPREVRVRQVFGPAYRINVGHLLGVDISDPRLDPPLLAELDQAGLDIRVLQMAFGNSALRFRYPLVTPDPLSEELGLADNYIRTIRQTSALGLLVLHTRRGAPPTLLARMLRHGALTEYERITFELEVQHGLAKAEDRREPELVGIVSGTEQRPNVPRRFERPIPALTGTDSIDAYLDGASAPFDAVAYRAALAELETLPTAELQRLLCETLAVCSSRLDAWLTSLASKRLEELRRQRPLESHVGGYGWLEDLRPHDPRTPQGGYVHAPSMAHATAAAVLRNAHLSRRGDAGAQVAVDLSSSRVRTALRILDGVRAGQPLGALLGYRFERVLHDRRLDVYIERFRRLYPLAFDPTTLDQPTEGLPPRDVVDGLALRTDWVDGKVPFGQPGTDLPAVGTTAFDALVRVLRVLDDEVDATADLLLAESVYQGVQGQVDGASATLSSIAAGARVPELDVVQSPRGGLPITHRVVLAIGAPDSAPQSPRSRAEPRLDAWIGTLLGDPATVRARIADRVVSLADLALAPSDVLALGLLEVERRVRWAARDLDGVDELPITWDSDPTWDRVTVRTFPEVLGLAQRIRALVTASRPLEARDVLQQGSTEVAWDVTELAARFATARAALVLARDVLATAAADAAANPSSDLTPVREALWGLVAFGVTPAIPTTVADSSTAARSALLAPIPEVLAIVARRLDDADAAAEAIDKLKRLFGELTVLPHVALPNPAELDNALVHGPAVVGDRWAVQRWLQHVSRVRPVLGRLRMVSLLAEPLGAAAGQYEVAQIPHVDGARWAALPFVDNRRPSAGTLSLVMQRVFDARTDVPWAGLTIDEWGELIPAATQSTGFAVHHDRPGAEAPQTILIAVPPAGSPWGLPVLVDVMHEALDLARIRTVDVDLLDDVSRILPGVYLSGNVADDTVSTKFTDALVADNRVVR